MRVLILATEVFSAGGIQQYTRNIINAAKEIPEIDEVFVSSFLSQDGERNSLENEYLITGSSQSIVSKVEFSLKNLLLIKHKNIDLILCNHVSLGPIAYIANKLFGTKYAIAAHGIEVWGELKFRELTALEKADLVLAVSQFTKKMLNEKHGINLNRTFILSNCVDEKKFAPADVNMELAKKLGVLDRKVLLTVGQLASGRNKGHETVMNAIKLVKKEVPNVVYLIVGDGDDRDRLNSRKLKT